MRTRARFPDLDRKAGHYESFYIKATRPDGGLGIWIRHTVHKRPGHDSKGSVWLTLFDAEAAGPRATKITVPSAELTVPEGGFIKVADAVLEPGRARGSVATDALEASWELEFHDDTDPFHHLPADLLYRAPLPRTKLLSPYPGARFSGRLVVDGREIQLSGWPGMIGHNWGAEHAERWIWIQGADLAGSPGSGYLDLAAGRIKLGPVMTPWVANGVLAIDGVRHRLGGFGRLRSTSIAERPTSCEFTLAGKGVSVSGTVSSEARNFVAWVYADPDGPEHNTLNCSISDLELTVSRGGSARERFQVSGTATYEIGMRETDHGIPLQPYADG